MCFRLLKIRVDNKACLFIFENNFILTKLPLISPIWIILVFNCHFRTVCETPPFLSNSKDRIVTLVKYNHRSGHLIGQTIFPNTVTYRPLFISVQKFYDTAFLNGLSQYHALARWWCHTNWKRSELIKAIYRINS